MFFGHRPVSGNAQSQKVHVPVSLNALNSLVYTQGLLYWDCRSYLLWFDPEKDCAGTIPLPYHNDSELSARQKVEVFNDEIV